jgi:hypothetical protein
MTRTRVTPKDHARPENRPDHDHARDDGKGGTDFDITTAFEELRNELVDVEALAAAADAALEGLPFDRNTPVRRATGRLYALVAATAAAATAALDEADERLGLLNRGHGPASEKARSEMTADRPPPIAPQEAKATLARRRRSRGQ